MQSSKATERPRPPCQGSPLGSFVARIGTEKVREWGAQKRGLAVGLGTRWDGGKERKGEEGDVNSGGSLRPEARKRDGARRGKGLGARGGNALSGTIGSLNGSAVALPLIFLIKS